MARSPTLSDAGMILPAFEAGFERTTSPVPFMERPPSPSDLYKHANSSQVRLGSAPQGRRHASQKAKSPSLSAQSSRSTLRNMDDSEPSTKSMSSRHETLTLSPNQNALATHSPSQWQGPDQRKVSPSSSSIFSEDFEHWPGFDSHETFEDSGVDLADQERGDHSTADVDLGESMRQEGWAEDRNSGSDEDDDPYSSAALSRRAEIILANAKKRLNVMEGNLRGARESLVVSPTFSSKNVTSDLTQHMAASRERDRRLYAGMGPIPPRIHSYRQSLLTPNSNTGHSRGLSETSVPLPFTPSYSYMTRTLSNKRASSAIGHTSGPWSPEGYGQGRFPIKESRSVEHLRNPRSTWNTTEREHAARSASRSSRSPPGLETLQEDEDASRVPRSTSSASSLRDQMNDLKGRISSLKLKAQEDHLRRRSIQSLRAPSPFTAADQWYSGSTISQATSPITTNTGLGITTDQPNRKLLYPTEAERPLTATTTLSQEHGEKLITGFQEQNDEVDGHVQSYEESEAYQNESEDIDEEDAGDADEADFVSVYGDETVYEDAVYEMPVTERHEDRVDAFDYETFFLHSAMGTYSLEDRRSSTSSGTSTATTRPVTAVQTTDELSTSEKRLSFHSRTASADSVSTVATFATAAEEQDDDEENEQMDQFSQEILFNQNHSLSRPGTQNGLMSLRSDSAINMRRGNGLSPTHTSTSRGSSSPGELASGLQTSRIFSILTEGCRDEARLALSEEETQLIYSLAASVQQVCSNLQSAYGEAYERKTLRRRLDEARKVLNGEDV
ncbi:2-oxoacid dehydrogenase acyltransferase [Pyrenophora seminiperda CCB06]|uniref:2-oxoacid dehydrogenase acyltransferase n=1 Tax=Pyrenophora seminiperda CCB06 TaxID=1302712 RepID=A0A3M7M3B9_9PLEO|nr:2-oxoacid dehydrogenase acyltransferase [Pyrenophora seminiperda CCB06]